MATVQGVVVDADDSRPIQGATVSLTAPDGVDGVPAPSTTVTDDQGRYHLTGVHPGTYLLTVRRLGYGVETLWLEVPAAWQIRQSVGLAVEPIPLAPLEIRLRPSGSAPGRLSVGRSGPDAGEASVLFPASGPLWALDAHRLRPEELPGSGALGEPDVLRALRRLPGVSSRGDFTATVWTRGAPWGLAPVLLDGLPLYDPLHLGGVATALAADALGEIALLPGVLPPSASSGAAGSVVLGTSPARRDAPLAAAVTPLAVRVRAEDRWLDGRAGLAVSARRSWWDYLASSEDRGESPGAMDYHFLDLSARWDLLVGDRTRVDAGLLWEEDRLEGSVRELVAMSSGTWGNRTLWLALTRDLGPMAVRVRWGRAVHEGRTRPLPWFSFVTPSGVPVLERTGTALAHRSLRVEASGLALADGVRWRVGYETTGQTLEQDGLEATERGLPGVGEPARLDRGMAWTEAEAHVGQVRFAGGLAVDLVPRGVGEGGVRPSARVAWSPLRWLTLEAAAGTSRQFVYPLAPSGTLLGPGLAVGHLWVLAGSGHPALTSATRTLSARVELAHDVTLTVSGFRRRVEGFWMDGVASLVDGQPQAAADSAAGRERAWGSEVALVARRGPLSLAASYSHVRATFSGDVAEAWPSPSQRPHALDVALDVDVARGLRAGVDLAVESGWPVVVGPSYQCPEEPGFCVAVPEDVEQPEAHAFGRAPGYASLDVRLAWERTTGPVAWALDLGLRNVLGRRNAAAYRVGTCPGAELISAVCERPEGLARFEPGLVRPTPSVGLRARF